MNNCKFKNSVSISILVILLIITVFLLYYSPIKIILNLKDFIIGIGSSMIYFINYYISKLLRRSRQLRRASNPIASLILNKYFRNVYVIIILILMATIEEFIFRSYLLKLSLLYLNVYMSVIACAILFSMFHFSKFKFIQLTLMGILFTIITLLTNNLLPVIVSHIINNVIIYIKYKTLRNKINKEN